MSAQRPHTNSHELISAVQEAVSLAVGGAHHVAAMPPGAQAAAAVVAASVLADRVMALRTRHERAPGGYDSAAYDRELEALVAEASTEWEGEA